MRAVALAALVLGACTGVGGAVEPALVGEYEYMAIDSGEAIQLRSDGTFVRYSTGMMALPLRTYGHWTVASGRVELRATENALGVVRTPLLVMQSADYPMVFSTRTVDGNVVLVDECTRPDQLWRHGFEWTRYGPPAGPR